MHAKLLEAQRARRGGGGGGGSYRSGRCAEALHLGSWVPGLFTHACRFRGG